MLPYLAACFGQWGMRLVIEGLGTEFVTDSTLAGVGTDTRTRVVGLVGDSIEIAIGSSKIGSSEFTWARPDNA